MRTRPFGERLTKPKVRTIYAETYKPHSMKIKSFCLPTLPSATPGYVVDSAYVMKAGSVELDGKALEFQDVRIYLRLGEGRDNEPTDQPVDVRGS
jgi:hypothetical protein